MERKCNGGPNGAGWCGKPATVVCSVHAGGHIVVGDMVFKSDVFQWFACDEHTEGAQTEPIAEWFQRHGLL